MQHNNLVIFVYIQRMNTVCNVVMLMYKNNTIINAKFYYSLHFCNVRRLS